MAAPKKKKAKTAKSQGKSPKAKSVEPSGQGSVTFRRFITLRNGKVLDAHDYGHAAWPIGLKR